MEQEKVAPLEDLMVAMDVVDTLRHRQQLVDRELDADLRRQRLIDKLREIYKAQGIEVTDQVLADGVQALEEDRFKYTPPEKTLSTRLAILYVKRDKWLKPLLMGLALLLIIWIFYYFIAVRPKTIAQNALPGQLKQRYEQVIQIAQDKDIRAQAYAVQTSGKLALKNENHDEAQSSVEELQRMLVQLKQVYKIRIVQQPGERSAVWRIPDANTRARNYYLIVEAIDSRGNILSLAITSEESGKTKTVSKWGVRVNDTVYQQVGADKQDDGIIQHRSIGQKQRGQLQPEYSIPTNGAYITEW